MSDFHEFKFGQLANEVSNRIGELDTQLPVFGVERGIGLTETAKYQSKNLTRYKQISPGMFAYNPMRLNIGSIGYCTPTIGAGLVSPDYVVFDCRRELVHPEFLYYFIKSAKWQDWVSGAGVGSVRERIYFRNLAFMPIQIPELRYQEASIELLSVLDKEIDLNRRINETLEATARLFFKDWFVDFGPTRAKAEGRTPYLAPELWSIFSDTLDDDDKPVGWSLQPLDKIANFLNGLALQKYPATGEDSLPVIKIAQLRTVNTANSDRASTNLPHQYVIEDGDVLFSWSGSLTHLVWTGGRGALNQHLFKVTSSQYPKWFFFYWISEHMPNFQAIAASKATTMGHIQRHHLTEALITVPTDPVLSAANDLISPLFDQIIANNLESQTLAQTRDLLLPRLMSGEIRLREAEKLVEQVA